MIGSPLSSPLTGSRHHVQLDGAVVGVDDRLHRVAHVVERRRRSMPDCEQAHVGSLRVGEAVGRGVAVDDPLDPTVGHHRIRIAVELQERCDRRDPVVHRALVEDPGVAGDEVGDQHLEVVEPQGERGPAEGRVEVDPALAVVAERHVLVVLFRRDLVAGGAGDRVGLGPLAVVDVRLLSSTSTSNRGSWSSVVFSSRNTGSPPLSSRLAWATTVPYPWVKARCLRSHDPWGIPSVWSSREAVTTWVSSPSTS